MAQNFTLEAVTSKVLLATLVIGGGVSSTSGFSQSRQSRVAECSLKLTIYVLLAAAYNLWFHPLSSYPGPLLARCSRLWYITALLRGRLPFAVHNAHQRYGDVVRIAPDELAFLNEEAWKDIYGHRPGKPEVPKDPMFYENTSAGEESIFYAPGERHGQIRRLLAHGFSERAMREQEQTIQRYISTCMQRLFELCGEGEEPVNMVQWYNVSAFPAFVVLL